MEKQTRYGASVRGPFRVPREQARLQVFCGTGRGAALCVREMQQKLRREIGSFKEKGIRI